MRRRPQPAAGGRPHVALRGDRQRGDRRRSSSTRPCAPRSWRRGSPSRSAAPGGPPRRGDDHRPLPADGDRAGVGARDAGDLHALRDRGRLRARDPHAHRGRGPGDDRLPVRAGACSPAALASGSTTTASPTTRSSASSPPFPSRPTTSAGSAPCTSGSPEGSSVAIDARDLLEIVESSMSSEIYELMKRSDEASWSRRLTAIPASSRTCVREMIRRVARDLPAGWPRAGSFSPARRTWRRSTATRSIAERSGELAEILAELARASTRRATPRCASGSRRPAATD